MRHLASLLFTGDGTDSNVMVAATKAIKNAGGLGIPTVKPVEHRSDPGENGNGKRFRCLCRGNVRCGGLPFLKNLTPPAGSKSVEDLREVKQGGRAAVYR